MADLYNYDKLLDNVYTNMPKKSANATGERFECPVADVLIQGSRSFVKNFDDVCNKLRRTPVEVAKYLFKELAAPGENQSGKLLLYGKFSGRQVNEKIAEYCRTHVICSQCGKPDTRLEATDARQVKTMVCEACGARNPVRG